MRTTINLPEDLLQQARSIAREKSWTLSEAVAWLVRRGLGETLDSPKLDVNELTGFPSFRIGRVITSEEVKQFLDEDE